MKNITYFCGNKIDIGSGMECDVLIALSLNGPISNVSSIFKVFS